MSFAGGRGTSLPLGIAGVGRLGSARLAPVVAIGRKYTSLKPSLKQTASLPLKKMVVFGKYTFSFF